MKTKVWATAAIIGAAFSATAVAESYVGAALQYQAAGIGKDEYKQVQVDTQNLNLDADDAGSGVRLFAGYRFTDNWGLELGYSDFSLEAGNEIVLSALEEEEWDAEFKVKQWDLQLTYFHMLTAKLKLKASGGVVWHDTQFGYSHKIDIEDAADQYFTTGGESESKIGVTAGLALQYNVWQAVDVLAGYQYSRSSLADNSAVFAGVVYHF